MGEYLLLLLYIIKGNKNVVKEDKQMAGETTDRTMETRKITVIQPGK